MTPDQAVNRAVANFEAQCLADMDAQEREQEAIDARADALVAKGGDYWPFALDNFAEALGDAAAVPDSAAATAYAVAMSALDAGRLAYGWELLKSVAQGYWDKRADEKARADIERERTEYDGD